MEQTFMTIHNLTPDANILYASESIVDILGYAPREVLGRSSFDYFHPDEVPFARSVHCRGVLLDKAAVLHYARILSRDGRWVSCECCFTIVHDVLVACTSIYRRGERSERRAIEAPQIRRLFSCSPRDPRYHMLEHLSPKFKMPPVEREPRAALILNRFTRTLSVMFATEAVNSILGVSAEQVLHKSFYECIRETSLDDAFNCLESAKANDSIAYLRFWSRDPRREEDFENDESENDGDDDEDAEGEEEEDADEEDERDGPQMDLQNVEARNEGRQSVKGDHVPESRRSSDSEGGGVKLDIGMDIDSHRKPSPPIKTEPDIEMTDGIHCLSEPSMASRTESSASLTSASVATHVHTSISWESSTTEGPFEPHPLRRCRRRRRQLAPSVEIEAVVSCTSDGLVVILRRARPQIPNLHPPLVPSGFDNGLFAAPWGQRPIQPQWSPELLYTFRPPLLPQNMPLRENIIAAGGPPIDQLMSSIRDVAVFAWALVGINGKMASYSRGLPMGEAQPPDGLPIWDPSMAQSTYLGPENQAAQRWMSHEDPNESSLRRAEPFSTEFSTERPIDNSLLLPEHENYSFGNGSQWLFQRPSQVQSSSYTPHHTYNPNLNNEGQLRSRQGIPFDQRAGVTPQSTGEWNGTTNTTGTHQLPPEAGEEPQHPRHNWYA
ncbi:hypothetical protein BGZ61DRAFT_488389 [Ilyonectria robusta]|uniref:uncharacterized protein n=1 Tax=Ilyonectria robusta TaxID=1079257 RepID=UPI001E8E10A4|nr:uncharacterized protein BGZ61DRAFT_488389 [Ilyonectria robusta]KAH8736672.1 hypothetical protein BGZ61DRAFT_488389 [Ilyonectria robusta]